MRRALHLLSLLLTLVAFPATATAGPLVGIADDRVLLGGGPAADQAVASWAADGVDVVRIFVRWDAVSPKPGARVRPAGAQYDLSSIDAAVDRVRAAGMEPMLTLTGPGPLWGMSNPRIHNRHLRPSPAAYASFAADVAEHFVGRVQRYILWNEPNLGFWLQPQQQCSRRVCAPVSPGLYRGLVNAAGPAIHAVDPSAQLLVGALAPRGSPSRGPRAGLSPLAFLRALACVDARYRPVRSGACRHFRPISASALAYHPHSITFAPSQPFPGADDANLASLGRLEAVLDRVRHAHRLRIGGGLWLDEYGYQTNPPDRFLGVSPALQDSWLQQAAYQAARDPRVKLMTQYEWIDEPATARTGYSGWQSGLLYANGRPKPALAHFAVPFFLDARRRLLWGQVRPGAAHPIDVQRRIGGNAWTTVAQLTTDARGYWALRARLVRHAAYRFVVVDGAAPASEARRAP